MSQILSSVPVYPQNLFSYSNAEGFVGDASDLRPDMGGRLYADACDYGFGIRSELTGKVVYFAQNENETQYEDAAPTCWVFEAVVNPGSALEGMKVTVFND